VRAGEQVGWSEVRIPVVAGEFSPEPLRPAVGPTQPHINWVPVFFFLGVKRPGREVDHAPPSSADVKNDWSRTCTVLTSKSRNLPSMIIWKISTCLSFHKECAPLHSYGSEVATIESLQTFDAVPSGLRRRLVVCYRRFGTVGALFKGNVCSLLGQTLLWCRYKQEYCPRVR
jgi:hypothetical protein